MNGEYHRYGEEGPYRLVDEDDELDSDALNADELLNDASEDEEDSEDDDRD
jgi:hypothetical protein